MCNGTRLMLVSQIRENAGTAWETKRFTSMHQQHTDVSMGTTSDISTRSRIGLLIYGMANAVLFGIGLVVVLTVDSLSQYAWLLIPLVVVASLILAWPIAWLIAPRLRKPLWRRRQLAEQGKPVGTPEERHELASRAAGGPAANRPGPR